MSFFVKYLKQHIIAIFMYILFCAIFAVVFFLYHISVEAVIYPMILCAVIGFVFIAIDFFKAYKKHKLISELKYFSNDLILDSLPAEKTCDDYDYREFIRFLSEEKNRIENEMSEKYSDMIDYYTVWAHQIKTPIASMRLNLQNEDSELSDMISEDLQRIEQYVEMVLMFLRLDSDSTDYIIAEYNIDKIVKQAIKKFAGQFIRKKIRLEYTELNVRAVTDEKWLLFVIEQVLSNSLKYTHSFGTVSIYLEQPKTLCIRDTGIGIAPEDLPRIFEKGYTGCNGREDKKASGIGLYLCKHICKNLNHTITADSSLNRGTIIRINFEQKKIEIE